MSAKRVRRSAPKVECHLFSNFQKAKSTVSTRVELVSRKMAPLEANLIDFLFVSDPVASGGKFEFSAEINPKHDELSQNHIFYEIIGISNIDNVDETRHRCQTFEFFLVCR